MGIGRESKSKSFALWERGRRAHRRRNEFDQGFPRSEEDIERVAPNLSQESAFEVCKAVGTRGVRSGLLCQGERWATRQMIGI